MSSDSIRLTLTKTKVFRPVSKDLKGFRYMEWIKETFPYATRRPFAWWHLHYFKYIFSLRPGSSRDPLIMSIYRGGGKTTMSQIGIALLCRLKLKRLVWIVSETKDQAERILADVGDKLLDAGFERATNVYGSSEGWNSGRITTKCGFTVMCFGLNESIRGIKIDDDRPDFIVFDDVDNEHDSEKTIKKKLSKIKKSILMAGGGFTDVVFIQNLIHKKSIMSRLYAGEEDMLGAAEKVEPIIAIEGFVYESKKELDEFGSPKRTYHKIIGGVPTWEGFPIAELEVELNKAGPPAFMSEKQQNVSETTGKYFKIAALRTVPKDQLPAFAGVVVCWDFAHTEGDGDYTVGAVIAISFTGIYYIIDMFRGQISVDKVKKVFRTFSLSNVERFGGDTYVAIPKEGGAGKSYRQMLVELLDGKCGIFLASVAGGKVKRSARFTSQVNEGNVCIVEGDWNREFKDELDDFKEDMTHDHDDIIDACSDGFILLDRLWEPTSS